MKLISFTGKKPDLPSRMGEAIIRWRTRGPYAHSAIMFEPGDGIEAAACMPNGSLEPNDAGEYWVAESVWLARIPMDSLRRPGHMGGAAIRRCRPGPSEWDFDDLTGFDAAYAARIAKRDTGLPYDLQSIGGFAAWPIPQKEGRIMCSEWVAIMLGIPENQGWRYDPNSLAIAVRGTSNKLTTIFQPLN